MKVQVYVDSTVRSAPKFSMGGRFYDKVEKAKHEGETIAAPPAPPGPGHYGRPSVNTRFRSTPTVNLAGSERETARKFAGAPGPTDYTPFDPNQKKISYGFGSEARIPKDRNREGHSPADPFKWAKSRPLDAPGKTMAGRGAGGKRSQSMPGPGAYKPNFTQTEIAEPKWGPGTGGRSNWQGMNKNPPPWHYKTPRSSMGPTQTMPTPLTYSFTSRRKPVRADSVPAGYATFSQFG